jgi:predicted lipoprotein with Yx(FWY)xxD motif
MSVALGWTIRGVLVAALAPVGMGACGSADPTSDAGSGATAPTPTRTAQPTRTAKPTAGDGRASLKVGQSRIGPIVVDASGRTLYYFTQDKPRRALCTSDYLNCTTAWPPLMTAGRPRGQAGVKSRLIGSLDRTKPAGSQVTYNHHPLYRYIDDEQPGDLNGQGLYDYWYVVSPSGRPIAKK